MEVLKHGSKIYGARLTSAERKALQLECERMIAEERAAMKAEYEKTQQDILKDLEEFNNNNLKEIDAMFLWRLHEHEGWGRTKLKRFYIDFHNDMKALGKRYEMETSEEKIWLCTHKLKEYGVDLDEWEKEVEVMNSELNEELTDK